MSFLNPNALYLFILIPIIILLYFLKLRRQTKVVSSIFFWMTAFEDMKANVPFQRFRKNLLLALQILFLLIVILGLARPAYIKESSLGPNSILIIDVSASMQSIEDGKTLLEIAKSKALKMIDEIPENGQMMLVEGSWQPSIILPFTHDSSKLRDEIEKISATDSTSNLDTAIELALSSTQEIQGSELIVLTDNNYVGQSEIPAQSDVSIRYIRYGKQNKNVAITGFDIRNQENKYQTFVVIQNFDENARDVLLWLIIGGHRIQSYSGKIESQESRELIFNLEGKDFDGKVLEIRMEIKDSLKVDNSVYAILHKFERQKLLVVSDTRNVFLEKVLLTNPEVEFTSIKRNQYIGMSGYDVALFYKVVPDKIPDRNAIFVYPQKSLPFMRIISKDEDVSLTNINLAKSIMRDIELLALRVKESLVYEMPSWGIPLIESTSSPLIWLGEWRKRKGIIFAFDAFNPKISQLVVKRSFPILMAKCLQWLGKSGGRINPDLIKAGNTVEISVSNFEEIENIIIHTPDKSKVFLPANESSLIFEETSKAGIYQVYADSEFIGNFAVNLLDEKESNLIRFSEEKQTEKNKENTTISIKKSYREFWRIFAIIALAILALEWWVYHRRVSF